MFLIDTQKWNDDFVSIISNVNLLLESSTFKAESLQFKQVA